MIPERNYTGVSTRDLAALCRRFGLSAKQLSEGTHVPRTTIVGILQDEPKSTFTSLHVADKLVLFFYSQGLVPGMISQVLTVIPAADRSSALMMAADEWWAVHGEGRPDRAWLEARASQLEQLRLVVLEGGAALTA